MIDLEVRLSTVWLVGLSALAVGLLVGAWWVPFLGWAAVLAGQGVLGVTVWRLLARQASMIRAMWHDQMAAAPPSVALLK